MSVNHTNYDPNLWNWCPDPQKYTELKYEGLPILKAIKEELAIIASRDFDI